MKKILAKTGGFFRKIGLWFKNHAPTRRRIIQLYVALLTNANIKGLFSGTIYQGATKNVCVPGLNCYSCPSTVGACPLGALQNALAGSGTKTPVYVLGILALFMILFARTICGFLCPTGLLQDLLYKIKTPKLKKNKVTRILSYFKYILLVVLVIAIPLAYMLQNIPLPAFCKYICPSGTLGGAILLLINPINEGYFESLGGLFTWKFCVLIVILVASVFMYRPFCRFVCPLGAIYGFFNKIALLGVKVEKDKCVDCGLCVAHCKMDIKHVGDHECIQCGECIKVCPTKAIVWKGSSIFVKPNDLESDISVKVPLTSFVEPAPAAAAADGEVTITADMADMMAIEGAPEAAQNSGGAAAAVAPSPTPMRKIPRPYIGPKGQKRLKITACILAAALLIGALVYYNFFDVSASERITEGNQVGDSCPDFSVAVYGDEDGETFTLSEAVTEGKVTVINFWGTWCTPCVAEIPYFIEVAETYADDITVVAIHSEGITDPVWYYIQTVQGWDESNIIFAQDAEQESGSTVYKLLGGSGAYPMTVILDSEGVITYTYIGEIEKETLEEEILNAISISESKQAEESE